MHHVISVKDFGPEDEFNLIGLCANHHGMLENLKRTDSPPLNKLGSNDIKVREWVYKIDAVKSILDGLEDELKQLVNLLLAPYPQLIRRSHIQHLQSFRTASKNRYCSSSYRKEYRDLQES
jgi:hypothetical protein